MREMLSNARNVGRVVAGGPGGACGTVDSNFIQCDRYRSVAALASLQIVGVTCCGGYESE
jgi:hypothetical protein